MRHGPSIAILPAADRHHRLTRGRPIALPDSRESRDPEVVPRLLFVGWDCVTQTKEKFAKKAKDLEDDIDISRTH